jgi:hypothetical protein
MMGRGSQGCDPHAAQTILKKFRIGNFDGDKKLTTTMRIGRQQQVGDCSKIVRAIA